MNYKFEYTGKHGITEVHIFAIEVENLDVQIILNEESIGYDWALIDKVKEVMQYDDEFAAFELIK